MEADPSQTTKSRNYSPLTTTFRSGPPRPPPAQKDPHAKLHKIRLQAAEELEKVANTLLPHDLALIQTTYSLAVRDTSWGRWVGTFTTKA